MTREPRQAHRDAAREIERSVFQGGQTTDDDARLLAARFHDPADVAALVEAVRTVCETLLSEHGSVDVFMADDLEAALSKFEKEADPDGK